MTQPEYEQSEAQRGRAGLQAAIAGTTRSPEKFGKLEAVGISPLLFDGVLDDAIRAELAETTHLVISTAPDATGDPVLKALREQASALLPRLQWIGYLSTVGVYGDHGGDWVDESSECRPVSRRSVQRLKAEQDWTAMAATLRVPLAILRLSGIYGPGRNAFVNLDAGAARRLVKPGQVFNRIHVADIAGALWFMALRQEGGVFNVTDDLPAPPQDVVTAAAAMMGVEPPPEQAFETAELTAMQRSFYGENKRVSNARLKAAGYAFAFPDYQAGLTGLWSGDWRGDGDADARSAMKK
ncbi:SDR family oxidoreductase [Salmonella enterica subsp. enterica]|nr:SDR family oxidoreductase [Escherichia coli]MIL09296.1 SDR family oxidoreductase [Salmonella enterica subsp. enterica serovar Enteritidis]